MMMIMMVTMMVNICDDDCVLVMKVILVKEVMSCDILPVAMFFIIAQSDHCLLYTSPSPRDRTRSRMPSSA